MPLSANLLVTGRTLEATTEEGEPADGLKSVWYSWSAPAGQPFAPVVENSTFPVDLRLFTGNSLGNLAPAPAQAAYPGGEIYQIRVAGLSGSAGDFTLVIRTPSTRGAPLITRDPQARAVTLSSSNVVSLNVAAEGENLSYQWLKDGAVMPNATNSALDFRSFAPEMAGAYSVMVSNEFGTATSKAAKLSVFPGFEIQRIQVRAHGAVERSAFWGVAVDTNGFIYTSVLNSKPGVEKIDLLLGSTNLPASLATPDLMAYDRNSDTVYFTDAARLAVYKIHSDRITQITGGGNGYKDGPVAEALFGLVRGIAVGPEGEIYVVDAGNYVIRKIQNGVVTTLAGQAAKQGAADGKASEATFSFAAGIALDKSGNIFVADERNNAIRKISPDGIVSTFAGSPGQAGFVDGAGQNALFDSPSGLAFDANGNLFVTEFSSGRLRMVTPEGVVVSLFARGPATASGPRSLYGLAFDLGGSLLMPDSQGRFLWRGFWTTQSTPPVIAQEPVATLNTTARAATNLAVTVRGTAPLTYQWFRNNEPLPGANAPILPLTDVSRETAGTYFMAVSNAVGTTTSTNVVVRVKVPERLLQPMLTADGIRFLMSPSDGLPEEAAFTGSIRVETSTNLVDWIRGDFARPDPNNQFYFDQPNSEPFLFFRLWQP